jgi:hypothetical protein
MLKNHAGIVVVGCLNDDDDDDDDDDTTATTTTAVDRQCGSLRLHLSSVASCRQGGKWRGISETWHNTMA